jgi:hypothetical protein
MVFAGLRDPCTRDVARLSESVKILEPQARILIFTLSESRATSQVQSRATSQGSRYPAWKTIW